MKTQIIEFHETEIYCPVQDGEIFVAVKPICEALGVDKAGQFRRIKNDEILSQLETTMSTTGRDNKQYEMICLPLQYIFGWLFTIDSKKVKAESKEKLISYKLECYNVLYDHFIGQMKRAAKYNEQESELLERKMKLREEESVRKDGLNEVKDQIKEIDKSIETIREKRLSNQVDLFD